MRKKEIIEEISRLLASNRLNAAIKLLREETDCLSSDTPGSLEIRRGLDRASETYRFMRDFLLRGEEDKGRTELFSQLKEDVTAEAYHLLFLSDMETSSKEFYSTLRLGRISPVSLTELVEDYRKASVRIDRADEAEVDPSRFRKRKEELLDKIFRKVWVGAPWDTDTTAEIRKVLTSSEACPTLRRQVISALFLSLLDFYDREKISILLDSYMDETDEKTAARLLTVIVPVVNRWRPQIERSRKLMGKLEEISDSILTYTRLRDIVMTMIRTRDTDRVSNEIKETFDIAMKNISPDLLDKMRREGLNIEAGELGENPEWDRIMKENNLEERFMSINEMQMQGMDVMMESFGKLKTFPFFREISHWFIPFDPDRTEIREIFGGTDAKGLMEAADVMGICGSDRYSFAFGFASMPKERRDMILSSLGMVNDMMKEQFKDDVPRKGQSTFATEALNYARDLYRFFKLYPKKGQFFDIFANPVDFLSLPVIGRLLEEEEILSLIGNFYFEYGYYDLALPMLERATKGGASDMQIYEKIGYCHQMTGNFAEALANYERADLFSSDATPASTWLLRKLALCNRVTRNYEAAAEYYGRLLERNPDDTHAEMYLGIVMLLDGKVKEGMERIAKIHYLEPDKKPCTRAYVKGLIMRGDDPESAYKAASRLVMENPTEEDYRLAGHASLLAGQLREAANFYNGAAEKAERGDVRKTIIDEINFLAPERFDSIALDILLDT